MKQESLAAIEPPPLLGFNNNVRHKGRLFHIQTEDSGVRHARLMTHLFADGGRIIKSTRTDYTAHIGSRELVSTVRALMKEQHRSMFIALRAGDFDEVVIASCGPYPEPESETVPTSRRYAAEIGPTADAPVRVDSSLPNPAAPRPNVTHSHAPAQQATRPAASFGGMPGGTSRSIFGDDLVSQKSLDEVILSYLAEDLAEES